MPYRRISITIIVVALVGALLTTLMPLTLAAPKERAAKSDVASTEEVSREKDRTGSKERDGATERTRTKSASNTKDRTSAKEETSAKERPGPKERTSAKERIGTKDRTSTKEHAGDTSGASTDAMVADSEEPTSTMEATAQEEVASGNEGTSGGDAYIIVLKQEPTGGRGRDNGRKAAIHGTVRDLDQAHGLQVNQVYDAALAGFAAEVPNEAELRQLKRDPRVKSVEPDRTIKAFADEMPTGVDRIGADDTRENTVPTRSGAPVAVLDSGIEASHEDLAGAVQGGYDCTTAQDQWGRDVYGHGTHVAGIISALNNGSGVVGVAPGTPLYDVKVLGDTGSGPMSWAICGLDWVTENAAATGIRVVNMSLGGTAVAADHNACDATTTALHNAVCGARAAGVTIVVAAGNAGVDANTVAPATYNEVTTVSALVDTDGCTGGRGTSTNVGRDDTRASLSNTGRDLDAAAPGVKILSTIPGNSYGRKTGTSMAAPHVAAAVALGWSGTEETRKGVAEGIIKVSANIGC